MKNKRKGKQTCRERGRRTRLFPIKKEEPTVRTILNKYYQIDDLINHNKYAKKLNFEDSPLLGGQINEKEIGDEYDNDSSPCSWSYWDRKAQAKPKLQELLAMHDLEAESSTHSLHSSILHDNKGKYKNIKELRRLYEVMKSYDGN